MRKIICILFIILFIGTSISSAQHKTHGKRPLPNPKILGLKFDGACVTYMFTAVEKRKGDNSKWTLTVHLRDMRNYKNKYGGNTSKNYGSTIHRRLPNNQQMDGMKGSICSSIFPRDKSWRSYKVNGVLKKDGKIVNRMCQFRGGHICQ